jgi:hypothetical protein
MIAKAVREEHPNPRPVHLLVEHFFKGYPGFAMLLPKIGAVPAHPANAHRLLYDEGALVQVMPEGRKGSEKLYRDRYRLRRFGRGGFVATAMRARAPIVPIALIGAEEAAPIFAHVTALQRLTGLLYFPITPTFPQFGLLGMLLNGDAIPTPGLLAALMPVAVGFGLGIGPLAGFLAGAIGAGALMAVFLANSGGAWDNAKKIVEDGAHGGKGSPAHEATIIGDTVGDPFKDTAGPAINPLLKVMNLVSLLIASAVVSMSVGDHQHDVWRVVIAVVAAGIIVTVVYISKQRETTMGDEAPPSAPAVPVSDPAVTA